MPYLRGRESVALTIPANQSIRIGNPRGAPIQMISSSVGRPNAPIVDIPATNITYGPYPIVTDIILVNNGYDFVEYVVTASPGLIDAAYNPAGVAVTGGTINGTTIGATNRSTVAATVISSTATDSTGTPGNVTNNSANGRAAFAAAASSVTVTNSSVAIGDTVQVTLLGAADATLITVTGVTVAAGSFTVTGNVAATATKGFMFTVIKA